MDRSRRSGEPALHILNANGVDLAIWDWPGAGPALFFIHATGFHGRCWDEVIRALPGHRAIALEVRGHGRSAKPAPPYPWHVFAEEAAAVANQLGLGDAIGIGHSMGGHTVALTAALRPETFASLFLIDPTIFDQRYYSAAPRHDASFVLKRRNHYKSAAEMFERFQDRQPFAAWHPQVLHDYCDYGLLPFEDGLTLACPPEIEASIYANSTAPATDIYSEIAAVTQPVTVMRGGFPWNTEVFELRSSPTAPDLASKFARGRDVFLEGRSHFIPMETPELVASEIERMVI